MVQSIGLLDLNLLQNAKKCTVAKPGMLKLPLDFGFQRNMFFTPLVQFGMGAKKVRPKNFPRAIGAASN